MTGQERTADIMEIAGQTDVTVHFCETVADMRHGCGGFVTIDNDPHELGARAGKRRDPGRRPIDQAGPWRGRPSAPSRSRNSREFSGPPDRAHGLDGER